MTVSMKTPVMGHHGVWEPGNTNWLGLHIVLAFPLWSNKAPVALQQPEVSGVDYCLHLSCQEIGVQRG